MLFHKNLFNIFSILLPLSLTFSLTEQFYIRTIPVENVPLQETIALQNEVLLKGEEFSQHITDTLLTPVHYVNNGISSAASTLPFILAAGGAAVGSTIAVPIQAGALAVNQVATGVTGTLVGIPIALASGGTAIVYGVLDSGREVYRLSSAQLDEFIRANAPHLIRPLSAVSGAGSVVTGMALHTLGQGVNRVGQGTHYVGEHLANIGQGAQNYNQIIMDWLKSNNAQQVFSDEQTPDNISSAQPESPIAEFSLEDNPSNPESQQPEEEQKEETSARSLIQSQRSSPRILWGLATLLPVSDNFSREYADMVDAVILH